MNIFGSIIVSILAEISMFDIIFYIIAFLNELAVLFMLRYVNKAAERAFKDLPPPCPFIHARHITCIVIIFLYLVSSQLSRGLDRTFRDSL